MSIPDRFARIARHKFNEIKDRIDQWDAEAEEREAAKAQRHSDATRAKNELDESLGQPRASSNESAATGEQNRPAPRTPAEIARGINNANHAPQPPTPSTSAPLGKTLNGANVSAGAMGGTQDGEALDYHYRLLGVEPGADFSSVEIAYNKLAARCDPARFPADSKEAQDAEAIRRKLETSFEVLRDALDVTARRFGLLDFDDQPSNASAAPSGATALEL